MDYTKLFTDGSTTPQGYTARGKTHLGGDMGVESTQSISSPVNQASVAGQPVTGHSLSASPGTVNQGLGDQAPVNLGNLSPVSQALCYQAPVNQIPGNQSPVTSQPCTGHMMLGTIHLVPVIQALVIMPDTSHWATRHQSPGTMHQSTQWAPVNSVGTGHQITAIGLNTE